MYVCDSESFKCNSGDCVDRYLTCDGFTHCPDGSDETELLCKALNIR